MKIKKPFYRTDKPLNELELHWRILGGKMVCVFQPMLIAIVGESGSGKTSLSLHLQQKFDIEAVCSYTTRPMREGETQGVEHWFVSPGQVPSRAQMLAYTKFGGYEYWANVEDIGLAIYTYIVDENGLRELLRKWKNVFNIIPVYVSRPNNPIERKRLERDKERTKMEESVYKLKIINSYYSAEDFLIDASRQIINLIIQEANGSTD